MRLLLSFERHFWFWCILSTIAGLFWPAPFRLLQPKPVLDITLMGILFCTCLKIDRRTILDALRRPGFMAWTAFLLLLVMPCATYTVARLVAPDFAVGFLILAAMPAGMAAGAMTEVAGGTAGHALAVTTVTSLLCPLTVPPIIRVLTGTAAPMTDLARQAGLLMLLLFIPLILAQITKRLWPTAVERIKPILTSLSIISLCLLVLGAMSANSATFMAHLDRAPALLAGVFIFSAAFHLGGFFIAPAAPIGERVALSVATAYVNNGLAIVFAMSFFSADPFAVLPAILIEFPMTLLILPLRWIGARLRRGNAPCTS